MEAEAVSTVEEAGAGEGWGAVGEVETMAKGWAAVAMVEVVMAAGKWVARACHPEWYQRLWPQTRRHLQATGGCPPSHPQMGGPVWRLQSKTPS